MGRSLGHGMREFKDSITGKSKHEEEDDEEEQPAKPEQPAVVAAAATPDDSGRCRPGRSPSGRDRAGTRAHQERFQLAGRGACAFRVAFGSATR